MVASQFVPGDGISRTPALTCQDAERIVQKLLVNTESVATPSIKIADGGTLAFWSDQGKAERLRLVWRIAASYQKVDGAQEIVTFGIDATSGEMRSASPGFFRLNRTTYSLHGLTDIVGSIAGGGLHLLWKEGFPNPADPHAYSAYNLVVKPRDLWARVGQNYDTFAIVAHWGPPTFAYSSFTSSIPSGYRYLIFGDPLSSDLDAVAHEYGNGVFRPKFAAIPSAFWDEWFAANEFYGDLSAVLTDIVERFGNTHPATWEMTSRVFRDLSNPKSLFVDNPASSYRDWYPERRWCCSRESLAYSNATIYGHALFLMLNGGYHARVGAPARGGPIPSIFVEAEPNYFLILRIFANALGDLALTNSTIDALNLKAATVAVARNLGGSALANKVANAWAAVGVGYNCSGPPPRPSPTITNHYCRGMYDINWANIPGVTYHGMVKRTDQYWDLQGQTVLDGPISSCSVRVQTSSHFRMRACNGCGCSAWTINHNMQYYPTCL